MHRNYFVIQNLAEGSFAVGSSLNASRLAQSYHHPSSSGTTEGLHLSEKFGS